MPDIVDKLEYEDVLKRVVALEKRLDSFFEDYNNTTYEDIEFFRAAITHLLVEHPKVVKRLKNTGGRLSG